MTTPKIARRYKKTPSLTVRKQWLDLVFNKNITPKSIASDYEYPISTVYYWLRKLDPKRKVRSDKGTTRRSKAVEMPDIAKMTSDGESLESKIELMINALMESITTSKKLTVKEIIQGTNNLTLNLKRLRSIQFESLAKELDSKVVESIIRRYEPGATEMRVIEVFREELARMKAKV